MKWNKLIIAIFVIFICFICSIYKVNASDMYQRDEIQVIGAQVRSVGNAGIRFVASVGEYDISDIKTYGIILAYGETEEEIYIDSVVNNKEVFICETDSVDDNGYYYVTLYDIPSTQYDVNVSARAYVKDVDGNIIYGQSHISRSLDEVVVKAYQDNDRSEFVCNVYKLIEELTKVDLVYEETIVVGYNGSREIIVIPENTTSIDVSSFEGCETLQMVVLSNGLKDIQCDAFANCESLKYVKIPASLENIYDHAFINCINLEKVEFEEGLKLIDSYAFAYCVSLKEVKIPNSVEYIGCGVFESCTNLESVIIPFVGEQIDERGTIHFGHIFGASNYDVNGEYVPKSLKNVIISGGKTESIAIYSYAFKGCSSILKVELPLNLEGIGEGAFYMCSSLESLTIPFVGSDKYGYINTTFPYIFKAKNCIDWNTNFSEYVPLSLKTVIITGETKIANSSFIYCENIETIVVREGKEIVEPYAFSLCSAKIIYGDYIEE